MIDCVSHFKVEAMDGARDERAYITIQELSHLSGRSVSSLRRDVRNGRIVALQPAGAGGKLLFRCDALERANANSVTVVTAQSPSTRLPGRRPDWMRHVNSSHART
jgi:hypothetical protein